MLRHDDGSLHYYLDGRDQGAACHNVPPDVYAVIDLYGQCAQVSIVHRPLFSVGLPATPTNRLEDLAVSNAEANDVIDERLQHHHWLPARCGKSVSLADASRLARRDAKDYENGLVFSASPLLSEEPFELRIEAVAPQWAGSFSIGLTTATESLDELPARLELMDAPCWFITGTKVMQQPGGMVHHRLLNYDLERLTVGDTIQLLRKADSTVHVSVNGHDLGVCLCHIPINALIVADLHGPVQSVIVTSSGRSQPEITPVAAGTSLPLSLSQLALREAVQGIQSALTSRFGGTFTHQHQRFHEHHGRNVALLLNGLTAQRTASYNQGLVYSKEPLTPGQCFQVKIEALDDRWSGSLMLGLTGISPDKTPSSPTSALLLKQPTWILSGRFIYQNGKKRTIELADLNQLGVGQSAGVYLSPSGHLGLAVDGQDLGPLVWVGLDEPLYAVVDLYGTCTQVTITSGRLSTASSPPLPPLEEKALRETWRSEKISVIQSGDCRYRSNCTKLIRLIGLPEVYFDTDAPPFCGCLQCIDDETKIDPCMKGWCSWTLKNRRGKPKPAEVNEKWQTAYHVTQPNVVRRILDEGQLLPPELNIWQRAKTAARRNDGESDGQSLIFSPSLQTASCSAPISQLFDPVMKMMRHGQVVLQVSLQPGSYKVRRASSPTGPQHAAAAVTVESPALEAGSELAPPPPPAVATTTSEESPVISEECPSVIFYQTKERGAALVQRLLIRLTDEEFT